MCNYGSYISNIAPAIYDIYQRYMIVHISYMAGAIYDRIYIIYRWRLRYINTDRLYPISLAQVEQLERLLNTPPFAYPAPVYIPYEEEPEPPPPPPAAETETGGGDGGEREPDFGGGAEERGGGEEGGGGSEEAGDEAGGLWA
jgi:uncharacterized membrane protein YgcG